MIPRREIVLTLIVVLSLFIVGVLIFLTRPSLFLKAQNLKKDLFVRTFNNRSATSGLEDNDPLIQLYQKNKNELILKWQNLPHQAVKIVIYRSLIEKNQWQKWKVISVLPGQADGSAEITIIGQENLNLYKYFVQVLSDKKEIIWSSSDQYGLGVEQKMIMEVVVGSPLVVEELSAPVSGPISNIQTTSNNSPQIVSPPGASPPSTPIEPAKGGGGKQLIYYYSPDGKKYESASPRSQNFWVDYINNRIELGWQDLLPGTNRIVIYRGAGINNMIELFEQKDPVIDRPYFIHLIDDAYNQPHYYQLNAYNDSSLISIYGPISL